MSEEMIEANDRPSPDSLPYQAARTLSIVREMAMGKRLSLSDGQVLAMGEDLSIGFVASKKDTATGETSEVLMQPLGDPIDLAMLDRILEREGIGYAIPDLF